jgi:hypothetical protein
MPDRIVPRGAWPQFFDAFSAEHEGRLVTFEVTTPATGRHVQARRLPLNGVTAMLRERPDEIVVVIGQSPSAHLTHRIAAPATVTLEQTDDGADRTLRITSESGEEAVLRFGVAGTLEDSEVFFQ